MTAPELGEDQDVAYAALQRDYLRDAPERLAELRKDVAAWRAGEPDALESLRQRFHRLAGSGGSYGFQEVTDISRAMEHRILTPPVPTPQDSEQFERAITDLKTAFDAAAAHLEAPMTFGRAPGFGWRTLVIMAPSPLRDGLVASLEKVGFVVDVRGRPVDPWDLTPSDHPDLVVIGTDGEIDGLRVSRYWVAMTPDRPRAVVLADPTERFDRLRSAAAGLDAVFGPAELPDELVQYARGLGRVGAPPPLVAIVEDDPAQAQLIASWLRQIDVRVELSSSAQTARDMLTRETPDLVLLDVVLPDVEGYAIARLMRQDPRLALVPIVFLTARHELVDEMEGLRAGGDDFLAKPVDRNHLLQVVLTRTERGRRIRELAHRDGLTGMLNHATLMAELEHVIAYSQRRGEPFCFLMLDLDHFKRVNDTYGHVIGDQVLRHAAAIFRHVVRAADLIGRYGGEEFGIILPDCAPARGREVAEKLRQALKDAPVTIGSGDVIHQRVSIGMATFVGTPVTATELTAAADRALYTAKTSGRDRVEMA